MAIVLASYGSGLVLEHLAHLHLGIVVEAVVLAMTLSRVQRSAERSDHLVASVVLPVAAIGASEVSRLLSSHPDPGDALFIVVVAASVWARHFGPRAATASALLTAPLVAVLILQGEGSVASSQTALIWVALVAVICCLWVKALQLFAARIGLDRRAGPKPSASRRKVTTGSSPPRLDASTCMALQMAAALTGSFVIGRNLWPNHWSWVVLTAFIVCSGARGRGDVVLKGVLRAVGAAIGTLVATEIAGLFAPKAVGAVVLIFLVLAVATCLRQISYAYWAGCVTAAISLLYGWFGLPADDLLRTRLEAIALGAVIAMGSSWLILPIRASDVLRQRCGVALKVLGDLLACDWKDAAELRVCERAFVHRARSVEEVAAPHRALGRLLGRWRVDASHGALVIDAIRSCVGPATIVVSAVANGTRSTDDGVHAQRRAVAANVAAVSCALGQRPGHPYRAALIPPRDNNDAETIGALASIDASLETLASVYSSGSAQPVASSPSAQPARRHLRRSRDRNTIGRRLH